jgi:hypothetical protein
VSKSDLPSCLVISWRGPIRSYGLLIFRSGYALLEAVIGVAVCPLKDIADNRFFSGLAVDALLVMPDEG